MTKAVLYEREARSAFEPCAKCVARRARILGDLMTRLAAENPTWSQTRLYDRATVECHKGKVE